MRKYLKNMAFNVEVPPEVFMELDDAIYYYELKSPGLGSRFNSDFLNAIAKLLKNPFYYSYFKQSYRRISLVTFPYMIIYKIVDNKTVAILSIVYQGRNPAFISEKISSE